MRSPSSLPKRMAARQALGGYPHPVLKLGCERLDSRGRDGGPMHEHGQITHAAPNPTRRWQAVRRIAGPMCVERVLKVLRVIDGLTKRGPVKGVDSLRIDQGDGGFDLSTATGNSLAETVFGIILGACVAAALRLNDDRPTAGLLNENVRAATLLKDIADLFSPRRPTLPQAAQHLAQGDVQSVFMRGAGHDGNTV